MKKFSGKWLKLERPIMSEAQKNKHVFSLICEIFESLDLPNLKLLYIFKLKYNYNISPSIFHSKTSNVICSFPPKFMAFFSCYCYTHTMHTLILHLWKYKLSPLSVICIFNIYIHIHMIGKLSILSFKYKRRFGYIF